MLLVDYLGPSLDTTISAIGSAIWLFANHPDQWDLVRRDTGRIPAAFNEVLRLETPISSFSRVATRETDIAGVRIPEGARVLVMFASANRDERRWDRPETFDCTRNAAAHVGFGYACTPAPGPASHASRPTPSWVHSPPASTASSSAHQHGTPTT